MRKTVSMIKLDPIKGRLDVEKLAALSQHQKTNSSHDRNLSFGGVSSIIHAHRPSGKSFIELNKQKIKEQAKRTPAFTTPATNSIADWKQVSTPVP